MEQGKLDPAYARIVDRPGSMRKASDTGAAYQIAGCSYAWHQPYNLALWASRLGEPQPHEVLAVRKAINMTPQRFRTSVAILHWVLRDI